tara:strand:+ start:3698 stop:6235 length:2538 start_codon:yes stop_codon:yes gene_type:complete
MSETTITINAQGSTKWDPNQEGPRFKEFLNLKKKDDDSLDENQISDQSATIISQCLNPNSEIEKFSSTGLIIGQVQSGKTLSMTAVSAMAQDNGYGIVIVMSGSVSPLSNQTAKRLVDDLKSRKIDKIINNPKDNWNDQDTQRVGRFLDTFNNPSIPKERQKTLLIVTHKNPAKIRKLTEIFAKENNRVKSIPTLIIDDECDHHSLNGKDYLNAIEKLTEKQRERNDEIQKVKIGDTWEKLSEEFGVSADYLKEINNVNRDEGPAVDSWILTDEIETITFKTINDLRNTFDVHTYLGYTATPQALTIIDQANKLKPDFVDTLQPGKGYTGLDVFFPRSKEKFSHENSNHICDLEDDLNEIISDNSKPDSFVKAVHIFLIGVAVGYMKKEDTETYNNRSMIIHPHNETNAHIKFFGYTKGVLDELKNGLSLNPLDNAYKETIENLKKSYDSLKNKNKPNDLPNFDDELIKNIEFAANNTLLLEFNARESQISEVNWDDEYSVILVGGVGLERGYTVKGLTVSYLSRSAGGKQKDTLLQRARFFGYHEKYKDYIQIYLSKKMQSYYQTISESNNNLFKSINKFKIENPNANFKDWIPEYIATNTSELNLTRKGVQRRNRIVNYASNHPLINRCNHLLTDNELRVNQELYKRLIEITKNSLKPLHEYENLKPEYKEWAENRSIHISTAANMRDLFELVDQLKFHSSEWREFLVSKKNFELYAKSEIEDISMRTCPIFFMNYKSKDDKDKERNNLKNSFKINPHTGKNTKYSRYDQRTYNLFPGDRMIYHDFITGEVTPESEINIGKTYASIQIYNFDKVKCKGKITENVPYFNIYPASDLWVDITRVE